MKDFDYFSATKRVANLDVSGQGFEPGLELTLDERLAQHRRAYRRRLRSAGIMLVFFAVTAWFVWGYRDDMRYAFSPSQEPLRLGNVADLRPGEIAHNSYVSLAGITEHRGMRQKMIRGLGLRRREFWYFRLLGSRGVFIEVAPDADRFGFATEVTVSGRAVDPKRTGVYDRLLADYLQTYFPPKRAALRVVQVGWKPGEGRRPFYVMFCLLALVMVANVVTLARLVLSAKH